MAVLETHSIDPAWWLVRALCAHCASNRLYAADLDALTGGAAQIDVLRVTLAKTEIRAPFRARVGLRKSTMLSAAGLSSDGSTRRHRSAGDTWAMGMGAIFDDLDVSRPCQIDYRIHITGAACKMNYQERFRPGGYFSFNFPYIYVQRSRINVSQNRACAVTPRGAT